MSNKEDRLRMIVRWALRILLAWLYRGIIDCCSVCEERWKDCACEVDQSYDNIEMASLRQEIRWLRGMLQP